MPAKLALAALIALAGSALAAEPYPDHPITLIVPYAAGWPRRGHASYVTRICSSSITTLLSKTNTIENSFHRLPRSFGQDRVSHDFTLHARRLVLQPFS
jgi:hypothetical protein